MFECCRRSCKSDMSYRQNCSIENGTPTPSSYIKCLKPHPSSSHILHSLPVHGLRAGILAVSHMEVSRSLTLCEREPLVPALAVSFRPTQVAGQFELLTGSRGTNVFPMKQLQDYLEAPTSLVAPAVIQTMMI